MTARKLGSNLLPNAQSRGKKVVVIRARCEATLKSQIKEYLLHPTHKRPFRNEGDFLREAVEFFMDHHPLPSSSGNELQ